MPSSRVSFVWVVASSCWLASACAVPDDEHRCDGDEQVPAVGRAVEPLSSVSCEERSDTGYRSGDSFSIDVVTIDSKPVEVDTANAYMVMAEAASRDGVEIRIVSGFRTMAEQEYLYACYVNCNCNGCNLAARPGHSNHQSGHALDLNTSDGAVRSWLDAHGGDYGFSRTVPSEAWHWEWWGGGPGGGPCGRAEPPAPGACPALGADGGEIEETSGCFYAHGPSAYWRSEAVGHGGSLLWTNAFTSDAPSNWARWYVELAEAGDYAVEVWAERGFAVHRATRYAVRHAGTEDTATVDLSATTGWLRVGVFPFHAGADQHVSVYDDAAGAVPADQHIPADAIRLTRIVAPAPTPMEPPPRDSPPSDPMPADPSPSDPTPAMDPIDDVSPPDGAAGPATNGRAAPSIPPASAAPAREPAPLRGGCSAGGGAPATTSVLLLLLLLVFVLGHRHARARCGGARRRALGLDAQAELEVAIWNDLRK